MDNKNLPRQYKVYIPLLLVLVLLVFIMPKRANFPYEYKKGSAWMYGTLTADFDFPLLKTKEEMNKERESIEKNKIKAYDFNDSVALYVSRTLEHKCLGVKNQTSKIYSSVADIYADGVYADGDVDVNKKQSEIYVLKGKTSVRQSVVGLKSLTAAREKIKQVVRQHYPGRNVDSLFAMSKVNALIQPNLVYNAEATERMMNQELEDVSTTSGVFRSGKIIVSEGAIITAEILKVLDSYKAEYDANVAYDGHPVFMWLGDFLMALAIVFVLFLAIYFCHYKVFSQYNKYLFLLTVFILPSLAAYLLPRLGESAWYYFPYSLMALFLYSFFRPRQVFIIYAISLLPTVIMVPDGMELYIMNLVAGAVCMLVFDRFSKGWLQFISALIVFFVMATVWVSFRLLDGIYSLADQTPLLYLAISAVLIIAAYPLVFLFEKIFGLVSKSKLIELTDTSNKLLRMLADKAPGTFQHSLQVMNLADAAARSIELDVPLIRAAALYHDIGKMANPHCFTENVTSGVNYHAELTPKESAQEIIKHVSDGLALADKHNLPQVLKDFIVTHHGTTKTGYFYNKYVNDGGDPADVEAFTYDGKKPETKEQVVLMLCDAIEAASRSLKGYSAENISALVDRIFEDKISEGQLSDSNISLRELNIVREAIKSYLVQMYHSRVAYPKRRR